MNIFVNYSLETFLNNTEKEYRIVVGNYIDIILFENRHNTSLLSLCSEDTTRSRHIEQHRQKFAYGLSSVYLHLMVYLIDIKRRLLIKCIHHLNWIQVTAWTICAFQVMTPLIQSICFVCIQSFHNADDFCFVDINILTDFKNACYLQIVRRTKFCIEQ